jgi:hypothetical protein
MLAVERSLRAELIESNAMPFLRTVLMMTILTFALGLVEARAQGDPDTSTYQELVGVPMVDSANGREMLSYLATCALPAEGGAYAEKDGQRFDFPGSMGLAPGWLETSMTESEQRWVSACILALKDGTGGAVSVSLRAANSDNPALRPSDDDLTAFTIHEGGFFGNLFFAEPVAFACRGDRSEIEDGDPVLAKRVCTQRSSDQAMTALGLTACGYRFIGFCSQIGTPEVGDVRYDEVIEVYLKPEAGAGEP